MIIAELYIKNFGNLKEKHIALKDDMQIIYGENETGKSTLHAFIRAMLFGMERGRGKAALKDDYTRYEPWEDPGNYGGVLWFECGGKRFRLERNFSRSLKRTSLVCEDDGEELSVEQGDLDILLGGMTAAVFDSTVSVGQLAARPGQELSAAMENYAANFCASGGGDIDVERALKSLRERGKEAGRVLEKERKAREEKREALLRECGFLEREIRMLAEELEEKEIQIGKQEKMRQKEPEIPQNASYVLPGTVICLGIISCILAVLTADVSVLRTVFLIAGILLFAVGTAAALKTYSRRGTNNRQSESEHADGASEDKNRDMLRLRGEADHIRDEKKEKEIRCSNLKEQIEEMKPGDIERKLEERCTALKIAEEEMKAAADALGVETADRLNKTASEIFCRVTDGRYRSMDIRGKLEITVWDGIRRIPAERLSRGTLEQIYFSVRMAAAEILQEETMPVILDDTFAFYDEKRLESALKWLSAQKRQVIILSCNKREKQIAERI